MKILQIVPSYKPAYVYGGPIESVSKLCEGLSAAGHVVHVYTTTANGKTELPIVPGETVIVDGVPVTYFKRITKDHTHVSPALWRQLYTHCRDYDLVHIESWWNVLVIAAAIICHARKVKVVISPRGMLSEYIITSTNKGIKKLIHSLAGKNALRRSYFHATSPIEYDECKRLISHWKGFLIPNIITLPDLPLSTPKNARFTLLFLSRIHPKKGIEFLLEALRKIPQDMLLKIAGDGEETYIRKLKETVKSVGIEDRVEWLGWQDREAKFIELCNADLFVLISYNENFANTVIESLYMGTPVLLSDQVGLASFIEKEKIGWVTAVDADAVAEKLRLIITQKEQLQWIREHSRALVGKTFSEQELIRQYVYQYEQVIRGV